MVGGGQGGQYAVQASSAAPYGMHGVGAARGGPPVYGLTYSGGGAKASAD
jgi:hypothetical protein